MKLKRILSFVLSLAMLLSILPTFAYAEDAEVKPPPYEYVFSAESMGYTDEYRKIVESNPTGIQVLRSTLNFDSVVSSISDKWELLPTYNMHATYFREGGLWTRVSSSTADWQNGNNAICFKIDIPQGGIYETEITYDAAMHGAIADVYIIDEKTVANENLDLTSEAGIKSAMSIGKKVGNFDTYHESAQDAYMDMAGRAYLPVMSFDDGTHYLIFTLTGLNPKMASYTLFYLALRQLELTEAVLEEMTLSLERDTAVVGIGTPVSVRYITDMGKTVDFEGDAVTFESGNTDIATVSPDGVVTGVSEGTVTISAKTTIDGKEYTDSVEIYVDKLVFENVEINLAENELLFTEGEKTLSSSAVLDDGTVVTGSEITVEYSSDNESVAEIENGVLKAIAEGEASITASVTFNNETKSVTRKVRIEDKKLSAISADIDAPATFSYDSEGAKIVVTPMNNDGTEYSPEAEINVTPDHDYVFNSNVRGVTSSGNLYFRDLIAEGADYPFDESLSSGKWEAEAFIAGSLNRIYYQTRGYLFRENNRTQAKLGNNGSVFRITVKQDGLYKPTLTYWKNKIGGRFNVYLVDSKKMTVNSAEKISEVTKNPNDAEKGILLLGSVESYIAKGSDWKNETVAEFAEYPSIELKAQDYYLVLSMDEENSEVAKTEGFGTKNTFSAGYLKSFTLSGMTEEKEPEELEIICTYESLTPDIVSVDENGYVHHVSNGTGKIKVTAEIYGEKYETVFEVVSGTQKTEPTIYTNEMRETALSNAKKYDWAKSIVETTTKEADKYVENLDFIYDHYPPEGIPRSCHIATMDSPQEMQWRCPHPDCLIDNKNAHGTYSWVVDPLSRPWKVQCPECKRLFPSNDFESFYKLGIQEDGTFSREKAIAENEKLVASGHPGYLVNTTYSDMPDDWMVDAGFGWSETEGYAGYKYTDRICPIAYYTHYLWNMNTVSTKSFFTKAIMNLRDAYLYTGDEKYGVAGAIIIDRFADLYPGYDFRKVSTAYSTNHGSTYNGKTTGSAWEKETLIEFIRAADAFYPMVGNEKVIFYLSEKAELFGLENKKLTGDMIRENWDNGILREAYKGLNTGKIYGNNGGSAQIAIAAGIALDCQPETAEYIEWAGITETLTYESYTCPIFGKSVGSSRVGNTGGNLYNTFFEEINRDGTGPAVGITYLTPRYEYAMKNAELMANYGEESDFNILELPKFVKMHTWLPKFTLGNGYSITNGDSGSTAWIAEVTAPEDFLKAFYYTGNPELAQIYYKWANGDLKNAYVDMFTDPSELVEDIEKVIETYGEYELHSENLAGYGLSILRGGELIKGAGGRNNTENRYDTWMYYGATTNSHAHYDALQLGLDAYGFNFTPDLGYPEAATVNPNRTQWIKASISHNLVLVDNDSQSGTDGGEPLHFDDSDTVKLFDAEAPSAYEATDIYRRTAVTVAASEKDAYTVDFFRVKGGKSHVYSFHTQSDAGFSSEDFKFIPQVNEKGEYVGTLASPEVARGADPAPGKSETKDYETMYPRGYTWLTDVNRADGIKNGLFSVNFKQTDFNNQVEDSSGLNLKYTAVNDWIPTELAIANGLPPQKSNNANVTGIDYMLITRESEEDLDTLFTSVLQPYKGSEYIESIAPVEVRIKSGRETADDEVKAIKVALTNKNTDYIVYATNNNVTYTISDSGEDVFDFSGFVGVYRVNEKKQNIYTYVHDGSVCGDISATSAYKGSVVGFTETPEHKNEIRVKVNGEVDASALVGKQIIIDNAKVENAAYTIKDAAAEGNLVTLDIGDVTLIDGLVDYTDISKGYTYNIAVGEKFTIPLTHTMDSKPEFDAVRENITTSAGSSVSVDVNASSPLGEGVTYIGTVLPRGASIDAKTGVVTWKPDASQIGETGFLVTARDNSGRESTQSFAITVYGSTTGASSDNTDNSSTDNSGASSGGGGGGGSSGQGSTDGSNIDTTDKTDTETTQPDASGETDVIRFTDLGNHGWARDAINTLAEDGIIKGTTATTYSPAANITRADFALLLVRAFDLESDNAENFADVTASDYFAPELAVARNTGIVNGIGDNKFAPRNPITRQDMMVIVYRAIKPSLPKGSEAERNVDAAMNDSPVDYQNRGVTEPGEKGTAEWRWEDSPAAGTTSDEALLSEHYGDWESVAPYARDAVSALIANGLVNGKSGLIAPLDYTTRAEVAVLLKRVLEYTK